MADFVWGKVYVTGFILYGDDYLLQQYGRKRDLPEFMLCIFLNLIAADFLWCGFGLLNNQRKAGRKKAGILTI